MSASAASAAVISQPPADPAALAGSLSAADLEPGSREAEVGSWRCPPFSYASSMIRAEQLWKFNATHDYVIGYFMWTGIDYLGEAGGWPRRGASSGVLDTCGFPKDGFYFYQSQWTTAPMVHLFPHWNYPGEKGTIIPVVVYSNCQQVELQLNGKSYGVKSLVFPRLGATRSWSDFTPTGTTADLHLTWDVPYEPGTLVAIARSNGQIVARDEIRTAGDPAAITLKLDKSSIANPGLVHIETRVVDAADILVPTANNPITFEVEGPAKIIATDNGDQSSHEPFQASSHTAFNGMALASAQASKTPGHVRITAKSPGLKDAVAEFDVTAAIPLA